MCIRSYWIKSCFWIYPWMYCWYWWFIQGQYCCYFYENSWKFSSMLSFSFNDEWNVFRSKWVLKLFMVLCWCFGTDRMSTKGINFPSLLSKIADKITRTGTHYKLQFSTRFYFVEFSEDVNDAPLLNGYTKYQGRSGLPSFVRICGRSLVSTRTDIEVNKFFPLEK